MKNIYRYICIIACVPLLFLGSCDALLDQDETDFGKGSNLVGFSSEEVTLRAVADGAEASGEVLISLIGPTVNKLQGDVTVSINVDPSSTAVEGVNYILETTTVTLSPDGSDLVEVALPVTIITEGIDPPLDEAPVLNLNVTEISSTNNVVINEKTTQVEATIAYTCPFNIYDYEGTYLATTDEFGIYINEPVPFEVVVEDADENQIRFVNVAAHPEAYDIIVDVDPADGSLSMDRQPVLNSNNIGYTYGELRWEGTGASNPGSGACIGVLNLSPTFTVDAGSFGEFDLVFEKQLENE